jgi:MYXO-CTERM domain-containing protein
VLEDAGSAAFEYADQTLGGNVTDTPLPAALPLFAGGLGLVALFSRRRKQNKSLAV